MHILDQIVAYKHKEVAQRLQLKDLAVVKKEAAQAGAKISISQHILTKDYAIIAEFKHKSPSKQDINLLADAAEVSEAYEKAGVAGISVLTDTHFFGGSFEDLKTVKATVQLPVLQKDFIVSEYQIYEAKAHGADFILLIAAVLTAQQIQDFAQLAQALELEVLVEIHAEDELAKAICKYVNLIGVNNRNLKTFEVNLQHSMHLVSKIPTEFIKVSESGISQVETIHELKKSGFQAFLLGENFMKNENPGQACQRFIKDLNKVT